MTLTRVGKILLSIILWFGFSILSIVLDLVSFSFVKIILQNGWGFILKIDWSSSGALLFLFEIAKLIIIPTIALIVYWKLINYVDHHQKHYFQRISIIALLSIITGLCILSVGFVTFTIADELIGDSSSTGCGDIDPTNNSMPAC